MEIWLPKVHGGCLSQLSEDPDENLHISWYRVANWFWVYLSGAIRWRHLLLICSVSGIACRLIYHNTDCTAFWYNQPAEYYQSRQVYSTISQPCFPKVRYSDEVEWRLWMIHLILTEADLMLSESDVKLIEDKVCLIEVEYEEAFWIRVIAFVLSRYFL